MKTIYIVRHCQAEGQEAGAPLTADGLAQADRLADLLADRRIERIVSSPYVRAKDSVAPLVGRLKLSVEFDERLIERVLCAASITDWQQHLEASFRDLDFCLEGGESSRSAMRRIVSVVDEIRKHSAETTLLATHGNLMALLLMYFDDAVGFNEWQKLTNPDVYRVTLTQPPRIQRL
jgi:2,3-bisphosphoglycerate-dependent phosphoglycerate mutase